MAAGQRPISNVVDITNYVMLVTGQPLHAFDLDRIAGHTLTVRRAEQGEQVQTLDGQTRRWMTGCPDRGRRGADPIAGVMGAPAPKSRSHDAGADGSPTWDGPTIHHTAWTLGLQSEASPAVREAATARAGDRGAGGRDPADVEVCGATMKRRDDRHRRPARPPTTIRLRTRAWPGCRRCDPARALREPPRSSSRRREARMTLTSSRRIPRGDVTSRGRLIEEVARLDGLEKLPSTSPAGTGAYGVLTGRQQLAPPPPTLLAAQGAYEVVGWSFTVRSCPTVCICRQNELRRAVSREPMSADSRGCARRCWGLVSAPGNRAYGASAGGAVRGGSRVPAGREGA